MRKSDLADALYALMAVGVLVLVLILAGGCASSGSSEDPHTIIQGAEGELKWGIRITLDPIGMDIYGKRTKGDEDI